ncbi:MAG: plastocyanin/azurin family copper-binding protein [Anaerolineales bacterium]
MNRQGISLLSLLVAALAISACGAYATPEPTAAPPTEKPAPTAASRYGEPESTQAPEAAVENEVNIVDSAFAARTITIPVGTTVTWTHAGNFPHTVTADDGSFDSGTLQGGATFSFTFDQPGTSAYYCMFHGAPGGVNMSGTIVVTED